MSLKVYRSRSLLRLTTRASDTYCKKGVSIQIFMVQRNFILTDVMKTGDHIDLENFIHFADIQDQKFDMTGVWYHLHEYNLDSYDRKIAFIDARLNHSHLENYFYKRDIKERVEYLITEGFDIVYVNPWECKSIHNFQDKIIWSGDVSYFWYRMYQRYKDHKFKFYHVKKPFDFLYLNKARRKHRDMLFDRLTSKDLLSNSLYSYHDRKIILNNDYELPLFRNKHYPYYGHDRDIYEPQFNSTKFNIVSETIVHDEIFMTEKIWKPIIAGQIFIVHGKHLYLQDLRTLGFKTYDGYIDEHYDTIQSLSQRTDAIVDLCEKLKGKSHIWLYADTRNIREHNQKIFFSEHHCRSACRKTIYDLLELVDSSKVSS